MMRENILKIRTLENLTEYFPSIFDYHLDFKITQFKSKKNVVLELLFEEREESKYKNIIVKIFRTDNSQSEFLTLKKLNQQEQLVPEVLDYKKPYLILKKIQGQNLCDFVNDNLKGTTDITELDKELGQKLILSVEMLADWLAHLHNHNILLDKEFSQYSVLNKGDTRLRDFLVNFDKGTLYGVDFEESYIGNHIDDLAWVCCSLLDTDPGIFQINVPHHKLFLINRFLKKYYSLNSDFRFDFNYFAEKLIENLNTVILRRNIDLGELSKSKIFSNLRRIGKSI